MKNRVPATGRAGRVKLTDCVVTGSVDEQGVITITNISGVFAMDDNATVVGSYYTKENVLPDDVCTALDLTSSTAEPKDAFRTIATTLTSAVGRIDDLETEVGNASELIGGET